LEANAKERATYSSHTSEISCRATLQNKQGKNDFRQRIIVIRKSPRPVYELEDLNQAPIDGQLYAEELTPVCISKRTTYQIDKILDRRVKKGILEYLVKWRGYMQDFNSWIPASIVQTFKTWQIANKSIGCNFIKQCQPKFVS
jgi:hypothetical protein